MEPFTPGTNAATMSLHVLQFSREGFDLHCTAQKIEQLKFKMSLLTYSEQSKA